MLANLEWVLTRSAEREMRVTCQFTSFVKRFVGSENPPMWANCVASPSAHPRMVYSRSAQINDGERWSRREVYSSD